MDAFGDSGDCERCWKLPGIGLWDVGLFSESGPQLGIPLLREQSMDYHADFAGVGQGPKSFTMGSAFLAEEGCPSWPVG